MSPHSVSARSGMAIEAPFTPEHELFRRNLRAYVEKELAPHALEWDEAGIFPREVFTGMAEIGALGINYPEEVGGSAGDYWYVVVLAEELVHSRNAGVNMALLVQSQMATPIINEIGTPEQKKEFLAPALAGEKIAALGISEPDAGSDVANLRTTARRVGDESLRYGNERNAFDKPLIKFQVWKHKFVEHLTAIEAARWLTYRAVDLFNRKEAAVKEISMAKLFAGDLMQRVVYDCQQFHGGMGYVVETPVARAFRDARLLTIGGGTSEIMKEIIAKLVPGF